MISVYRSVRLCAMAALALSATACSSTPDRYAFWRDDVPASATADETMTTSKPNLADIPASPDVNQARKDMQDLQTKLAADRDAANQQAQNDKDIASGKMVQPLAAIKSPAVNDDNLPPVGANTRMPSALQPKQQGMTADAAPMMDAATQPTISPPIPGQPALANPNRSADGTPNWPVYVPPSVQINPPLRPYASLEPAPDYAYGRSAVQYKQRAENGSKLIPPAGMATAIPQVGNNDNVTVDMSALGGAPMGTGPGLMNGRPPFGHNTLQEAGINGVLSNKPAVYFKHGSTRLSAADRKKLVALATKADAKPIQVIGHASSRTATTSPKKAKAINMKVSATRAEHVLEALTQTGVPAERITTKAVGDRDANKAPSEAAARRVDVLIGQ